MSLGNTMKRHGKSGQMLCEALHLKLTVIPVSYQILAESLLTALGSFLVLMLSGLLKTRTMHIESKLSIFYKPG